MNLIEKQNNGTLYIHPSKKIETIFTEKEMEEVLKKLEEIMMIEASLSLDLWTVNINNKEVWGLFDTRAGPNGEDLLTIIFSEEF